MTTCEYLCTSELHNYLLSLKENKRKILYIFQEHYPDADYERQYQYIVVYEDGDD